MSAALGAQLGPGTVQWETAEPFSAQGASPNADPLGHAGLGEQNSPV